MVEAVKKMKEIVTLPSDQDSSGRTLGEEEISLLKEAIQSGILTSTKGKFVKRLEEEFARMLGVKYAWACSSGSAAIHSAIAAINPEPGDEIITTAITDMGAITPILYQGAIPVFVDVDARTLNVTAATIKSSISDRTKAIIVTHLFGNPCNMKEIQQLAAAYNIPIIEDCAQAFLSKHQGQWVGNWGSIGCFSLQQGKHITTGEGGLIVTNNEHLARHIFLFINKAWGYGDAQPDHYFLALNYRMSELQGAVALAQLAKLSKVVETRRDNAAKLTQLLENIPGIGTPHIEAEDIHTYWKYCLRVDSQYISGGAIALAKPLKARGIACAPRYIQKPAFECEIIQKQRTFGNSGFPFTLASPEALNYSKEKFSGTYLGLEEVLVLPWNEAYNDTHISYLATSIRESLQEV